MSDLELCHISSVKSFQSETTGGNFSLFFSSDLSHFRAHSPQQYTLPSCPECPPAAVLGTAPCTELLSAVLLRVSSRRKPMDLFDVLMGREAQSLSQKSRNANLSLLFVFIFLLFLPPGVAGRTEPPMSLCAEDDTATSIPEEGSSTPIAPIPRKALSTIE